jgi:cation-transporting P-type ATPase E
VIVLEDEPGKRRLAVAALCALMALAFALVCAIPAGREFFDLATPTGGIVATWAIGLALLAIALRAVSALERRKHTALAASAG